MRLRSQSDGERVLEAADFFLGPMFTAVGDTECLVEIEWPVWSGPGQVGSAFEETAMRHGDFAMASAACQLQVDADGLCRRAAIGLGGMDGTPLAFAALAAELVGQRITPGLVRSVAHAAAAQTDPGADLHAEADYRRHLGEVMLARAIAKALQQAQPTCA